MHLGKFAGLVQVESPVNVSHQLLILNLQRLAMTSADLSWGFARLIATS
jgi:hypothetical protein